MMPLRSMWARALLVMVLLGAALGWMIWQRVQLLHGGQEIVLKIRPIDPRDLFRGHYVRLGYEISRIAADKVAGGREALEKFCGQRSKRGNHVHVVLLPGGDGYWHLDAAYPGQRPASVPAAAVVMRGEAVYCSSASGRMGMRYGIERYYAPKARAQELEKLLPRWRRSGSGADRRDERQPLGVIVRVDPASGQAVIAGLMIDGRKIYEESLF